MELSINKRLQKGIAAHKAGKLQEAEALYRNILKTHPTDPDTNHSLGYLIASTKNIKAALPFFKIATKVNPNQEQFWISYVNALLKDNQINEAEICSRKAIKSKKDFAVVHCNLGSILQALGRLEEAILSYKKATDINPNYAIAHNNLGSILKDLGRLDEAELNYKKAIALKPDYFVAQYSLGNTLYELGKFEEAELSFKKIITLKPDLAEAYSNLSITLKELGKLDEAEISCRKAIALKPDYAESYVNLNVILLELGKLDEAEISCRKVIALKPDHAVGHNNLGNTLKEFGKLDEAEISYRKAIECKPNYVLAYNNLDILLKQKELLRNVLKKNIKVISANEIKQNIDKKSNFNPFISNRKVEAKLIANLYNINASTIDKTKGGPLFGAGKTSDYKLFDSSSPIIKTVEKDLINIMQQAVKSEVFILDSFFNILTLGGGSIPHNHINNFDKVNRLINKKYSLTYYLSVGDQNCSQPGTFKLYNPDKKILPSEGMIMIIPADRTHSAIYSGKIDRVMIGVNFYAI